MADRWSPTRGSVLALVGLSAFLAAVVLGLWGFLSYTAPPDAAGVQDPDLADAAWGTLTLFGGDVGAVDPEHLPWQLQTARLIAPGLAAAGAVAAGVVLLRRSWRRGRVRAAKGHTIVCGDDERSLLLAEASAGQRVVVVAPDIDDTLLDRKRVHAVAADPADGALFRAVNGHAASYVFAVGPDERANAEIALAAADACAAPGSRETLVVAHVRDLDRRRLLTAHEDGAARVLAVDVDALAAERLLADQLGAQPTWNASSHVVVVGASDRGQAVVRRLIALAEAEHAAALVAEREPLPRARPTVTLLGPGAVAAVEDIAVGGGVDRLVDLRAAETPPHRLASTDAWPRDAVTGVVVCIESPVEAVVLAQALARRVWDAAITVDVATASSILAQHAERLNTELNERRITIKVVETDRQILTPTTLAADHLEARLDAAARPPVTGRRILDELHAAGETVEEREPGTIDDADIFGAAGVRSGLGVDLGVVLTRAGVALRAASAARHLAAAQRAPSEEAAVVELAEALRLGAPPEAVAAARWDAEGPAELARLWLDWRGQNDTKPAAARARFTSGPPVFIAGGVETLSAAEIDTIEALLDSALLVGSRTLVSGGTCAGVPGAVARAARRAGRVCVGYAPHGAGGCCDDLVEVGDAFSVLQPLRAWADVLADGHAPEAVRVVAFPGGSITRQEIAVARAFGAYVGLVALKDRPVEPRPDGGQLAHLPADGATLRSWIEPAAALEPDLVRKLLAAAVHRRYVSDQQTRKLPDDEALRAFDLLPEPLKQSNFAQVDDIPRKLELLGLRRVPKPEGRDLVLSDDDVLLLAEHEHGRWNAERLASGWTLGPRHTSRLRSPYLVPWSGLDPDVRAWDVEAVRGLPDLLDLAGQQVEG